MSPREATSNDRFPSPPDDRDRPGRWLAIAVYLAAVAAVNPLRECPVGDDWAYAATVWHFLRTGQYRLHEWLSANIPFQTIWGAAFCRVFGESFVALRLSTVVLFAIGLAAFRALALEHGISRPAANLLALCVASSSLLFRMSLSFMTDVPFFVVTTVALLFYTRALRRMTLPSWGIAALAGGAAVLTRQFGAAILPAVGLVWLVDRQRMYRLGYYLCGISLPALATAWQLNQGWNHANWAAEFHFVHQRSFFWGDGFFKSGFLKNLPWRPTVLAEYLALWLVPLVLLAAVGLVREIQASRRRLDESPERKRNPSLSFAAWTAFFSVAVVYGWKVVGYLYDAPHIRGSHAIMPFLGWNYEVLHVLGEPVRWGVTVFVVIGAALFARIVWNRHVGRDRSPLSPAEMLLDFTFVFSLGLNLAFSQLWDQYLLVYITYAAIVVGKRLEGLLADWRRPVIGCCLLLMVGSAIWTREDLAKGQAMWGLCQQLHRDGIAPNQIFADWEWLLFWNFEDYVRDRRVGRGTSYADIFGEIMPQARASAEYWIVHDPNPPPGEHWKIIHRAQYFSVYARGNETFYAVQRERPRK